MQKNLVSLLTPMYNTEKYVHRLLDSVLRQTYPAIEMIIIDDGSTDNSRIVVSQFIERFKTKGYTLKYFYQENSGQSVAIKNGLSQISGEYLAWPDSDDYYATIDAIEQMVDVLRYASEEFQMVRTQEALLEDEHFSQIGLLGKKSNEEEQLSLFYDCLYDKNGYFFCPGAYMVRTEALYKTTHFDIYTDRNAGQNWQLMLPILHKYRCKTIRKPLYNVVVRKASHSRGQYQGYDALERKYLSYYVTRIETLKRIIGISPAEIEFHTKKLKVNYIHQLFRLSILSSRPDKLRMSYIKLKNNNSIQYGEYVLFFLSATMNLPKTAKLTLKIYNKLKRILH